MSFFALIKLQRLAVEGTWRWEVHLTDRTLSGHVQGTRATAFDEAAQAARETIERKGT